MVKKRLFIAFNLPAEACRRINRGLEEAARLYHYAGKEFPPSLRWRMAPEASWHITLLFLDYQNEELLSNIAAAMANVAARFSPPIIELDRISYGPQGHPKHMWVNGSTETSAALKEIKSDLENELVDNGVNFKYEAKKFQTHITLATFPQEGDEPLVPLDIKLDPAITFQPQSLDLMESDLLRGVKHYSLLQSASFGGYN